jgi:hypothetical protein
MQWVFLGHWELGPHFFPQIYSSHLSHHWVLSILSPECLFVSLSLQHYSKPASPMETKYSHCQTSQWPEWVLWNVARAVVKPHHLLPSSLWPSL